MNAQEIKQLRKRLGMNQTQFADRIGTNRRQIYSWEHDRNKPRRMAIMVMQRLDEETRRVAEPEPVYDAG